MKNTRGAGVTAEEIENVLGRVLPAVVMGLGLRRHIYDGWVLEDAAALRRVLWVMKRAGGAPGLARVRAAVRRKLAQLEGVPDS